MAGFTGQAQFRGAHGRHHEAKDELEDGGGGAGRLLRRLFRGNTDLRNSRRRALFLLGVSTAEAGDAAPGMRLF